jgi:hypothetical protein
MEDRKHTTQETLNNIVAIETTISELEKKILLSSNYVWFREILDM